MERITILIAEDHKLIREAWRLILSADSRFFIVGECESGEEVMELVSQLNPHIILMDINLPGKDGIDTTRRVVKLFPETRVIGVSMHSIPDYARRMLQFGAMGYVTKNSSGDELIRAITEVHSGRKYICEEIKHIISEQVLVGELAKKGLNSLSRRETEIISFIKNGYSSREIAESLLISIKTVEVHRYNILRKLNLKNSVALAHYIHAQMVVGK